jgi:putative tricarboxylic transport membrane protein
MLSLAFQNVLTINGVLLSIIGTAAGMVIGALPGLSAAMGIALLMPITYSMNSISAFIVLCGVYVGAIYGGSITAILLRTPGTPASGATVLDGYEFTKNGEAGRALGISTVASSFGGLFSAVTLMFLAPVLAQFALSFTPVEKAALAFFGLSIVTSMLGKDPIKGSTAALAGMLLSLVGIDLINGKARFNLGLSALFGGFELVPAMVGLLAMSQVYLSIDTLHAEVRGQHKVKNVFPTWQDLKACAPAIFLSSVIGTIIGIIPGTGGDIASYVSYNEAKRISKRKELFGTGIPEGVAAPEAANNAVTGGAMIPMMTLGIPGDAATAVMLGALMLHGLQAGTVFFKNNPEVSYSIFGSMFLANIIMVVLGLFCLRLFIKIVSVKKWVLNPIIIVLCVIGAFCVNNTFIDVWVMLGFSVVGYAMEKCNVPVSPMVLALILGRMFEGQLRLGVIMNYGSFSAFFTRPISLAFIIIGMLSMAFGLLRPVFAKHQERKEGVQR